MPVRDHIHFRAAQGIYKVLNGLAPDYIRQMLVQIRDHHTRSSRAATRGDIYVRPGKHTNIYMGTFAYAGVQVWNNLPTHIRTGDTLSSFKSKYRSWYWD